MSKKKPGGRSFYSNKKLGFYLGAKNKSKNGEEKSGGEVDNQAKGVNMKNSNVSHRTCQ